MAHGLHACAMCLHAGILCICQHIHYVQSCSHAVMQSMASVLVTHTCVCVYSNGRKGAVGASMGRTGYAEPRRRSQYHTVRLLTGGRSMCTPPLTSHPKVSSSFMLRHHSFRYTFSPAVSACLQNPPSFNWLLKDVRRGNCLEGSTVSHAGPCAHQTVVRDCCLAALCPLHADSNVPTHPHTHAHTHTHSHTHTHTQTHTGLTMHTPPG
jgi:hypothetical protein